MFLPKRWKSEEVLSRSNKESKGLSLVIVDIEWEFEETRKVRRG